MGTENDGHAPILVSNATDPDVRRATIARIYSSMETGDEAAFCASFTSDCTIRLLGDPALNPMSGNWSGHDGVRYVFGIVRTGYEGIEIMLESVLIDGNQGAAFWRSRGIHRMTGSVLETERCDRFEFRGALVSFAMHYFDTATIGVTLKRLERIGSVSTR